MTTATTRNTLPTDHVPGLPGLPVAGLPAAPRPDILRYTEGPLFAGVTRDGDRIDLARHRALWGELPTSDLDGLAGYADAAGLRGAGGAGFPTARKLRSMQGRRVTQVIINGNEGEETSAKDGQLLRHVPHQVLDGAALVAHATGTRRVVVRLAHDRPDVVSAVRQALSERSDRGISWKLSVDEHRFVSGEANAVIRGVSGGDALPHDLGRPPSDPRPRLGKKGSVFLSNVETFARLSLATRGVRPTSALITLSGAVASPGVYEVPTSWTAAQVVARAGLLTDPDLVITGGWHGRWVPWARLAACPLGWDAFEAVGARWGAGVLVVLPPGIPPRQVLTAIANRLAGESAGQCGPCVLGLPALARELARGGSGESVATEIDGRGLCAHPTATVAAVRSALTVLGDAPSSDRTTGRGRA